MDDKTFNQAKRTLNIAYRDIFHAIPCIQDYSCSREEYLSAMKKSIESGQPIDTFLNKKGKPLNSDSLT